MEKDTQDVQKNQKKEEEEEVLADEIDEFVRFGRAGRRNAIADVKLDPNSNISTKNITSVFANDVNM